MSAPCRRVAPLVGRLPPWNGGRLGACCGVASPVAVALNESQPPRPDLRGARGSGGLWRAPRRASASPNYSPPIRRASGRLVQCNAPRCGRRARRGGFASTKLGVLSNSTAASPFLGRARSRCVLSFRCSLPRAVARVRGSKVQSN